MVIINSTKSWKFDIDHDIDGKKMQWPCYTKIESFHALSINSKKKNAMAMIFN
jgi:hypothetical protein